MTAALRNWSGIGPGSSDAELAVATAAGDRTAFGIIYDRYADRLHDFAIGMLRDRDSAADIVQDAFCIMSTSLGGLREPEKLRPWLYSIVRNEAHKRLRELKRERPSDEMPDVVSHDSGPDTMAQRLELANLISEAAGGLSDRDQAVLELAYRQGLDGPELAMALGVTQTNANTMVGRLRETIERSLGALLVARRIQSNPASCPELASVLHGWDGKFNILMRKRIARHIESCEACEDLRSRSVNPAALLGAPVFIPAPAWLKNSVTRDFELTSASKNMGDSIELELVQFCGDADGPEDRPVSFRGSRTPRAAATASTTSHAVFQELSPYAGTINGSGEESKRRVVPLMALIIGLPILILGATLAWLYLPTTALSPSGVVQDAPSRRRPRRFPPRLPPRFSRRRRHREPLRPRGRCRHRFARLRHCRHRRPRSRRRNRPDRPPPSARAGTRARTASGAGTRADTAAAGRSASVPTAEDAPAPESRGAITGPTTRAKAGSCSAGSGAEPPIQPPAQSRHRFPGATGGATARAGPPPVQKVPDPVGPAPQQVPDPVGPAPKKVEPPAQTPCNPDVDVCVR